ncbi:MAG: hypothetical protein ACR2QK_11620, partial [Acidimicrobiales bacterium]
DILAGATGMIFVALTIGYLPTMYAEVTKREVLVKQLEGWAGTPSWGPAILARFASLGAVDDLPALYRVWDTWAAQVADSHMKYPVLTHFRLPRSRNHWLTAFIAVMDAAALGIALQPDSNHAAARLFLHQGTNCLRSVAYPMRRVETGGREVGITRTEFDIGLARILESNFPIQTHPDEAWTRFSNLRSSYAHVATQLTYWTIAAPAPWSGPRPGFPDLTATEPIWQTPVPRTRPQGSSGSKPGHPQ